MLGLIAVNLRRHRARNLLTAMGIAIGVATIVALLALTQGLKDSANGLIHLGKADFGLFQRAAADPTQSVLPDSLIPRIARSPEVRDISPVTLVTDAVPRSPAAILFGLRMHDFVAHRLVTTSEQRKPRGRPHRGGDQAVGDEVVHAEAEEDRRR